MPEQSPAEQLKAEFARWDYLYEHGGHDPFWSDGVNLNLVRNHVIYAKNLLDASITDGNYPDIYYRDIPPEVDTNYMARADEIRANAANTLKVYQADEQYLWCKAHLPELTPKELKCSCIENILGYVTGLEQAIAEDDFVTMLRHECPERYADSFERGVKEIQGLLAARKNEPQLDIFSAVPPSDEDDSEDENENEDQEIYM